MKIKTVRGYIFSRKFLDERVPQHVQNIVIRDYCKNNNLQYLLSSTEYILEDSHLMMQQLMNEIKKTDGIVAYSLFQLPKIKEKREEIYQKILKNRKELHFAVEKLKITTKQDTSLIEQIWLIKQTLPLTPDVSKIKKYFN